MGLFKPICKRGLKMRQGPKRALFSHTNVNKVITYSASINSSFGSLGFLGPSGGVVLVVVVGAGTVEQ